MKDKYSRIDPERCVTLSLDNADCLLEIRSAKAFHVLIALASLADPETCYLALNSSLRKRMLKTLGIARSTFSEAIGELLRLGILSRYRFTDYQTGEQVESPNEFWMNPWLLWRGDAWRRIRPNEQDPGFGEMSNLE